MDPETLARCVAPGIGVVTEVCFASQSDAAWYLVDLTEALFRDIAPDTANIIASDTINISCVHAGIWKKGDKTGDVHWCVMKPTSYFTIRGIDGKDAGESTTGDLASATTAFLQARGATWTPGSKAQAYMASAN